MYWQLLVSFAMASTALQTDPAADQLEIFLQEHPLPVGVMTTSAGRPVPYSEATNTLNIRLIFNEYFMDSLTHLTRERIPERVVHTKAGGAFGYFKVTQNISHICKASLFSTVGKRTRVAMRFSPIVVERGGSDTLRDARGFAIKFYTDEGNFDMVGFNQPVFVVKDPILFPSFIHSQKKNPATNLFDAHTFWDFLTLHPESFNLFLRLFSDSGIPNGYGNMQGFSIHTYQLENRRGEVFFARFHFTPEGGVKTLSEQEASKIRSVDPDYNTRNLYRSIGNGVFPKWRVALQIVTPAQVNLYGFDYVFDVTRSLPLSRHPLTDIGEIVLDENYLNYFAQIEQLAVDPGNLVPGILGAPDALFEARRLAYREAANYRLGSNFNRVLVNCPLKVLEYNRDGTPPVGTNELNFPNYFPNSFNSPVPYKDYSQPLATIIENQPSNFDQMTDYYANEITSEQRSTIVNNIMYSLRSAAKFLQDRAVDIFTKIHPDLGHRIRQGLIANRTTSIL